jgi:hypothetical protein
MTIYKYSLSFLDLWLSGVCKWWVGGWVGDEGGADSTL